MALINKLSAIGNAIREKTGKKDLLTLDQMPQEIKDIETGGGNTSIEDSLVDKTLCGSYTNNRITKVGAQSFRTTKITDFNSTSVTEIETYGFFSISTLEECNTPNVIRFSGNAIFQSCTNLKKIDFPKNTQGIGGTCFSGCTALSYANIGDCTSIAGSSFSNCSNLETLIITRTNSVPSMSNINAFSGSAIANGTGYIYVADNLYESYKTATNWSTYANQIRKLSEYEEEM